MPAISTLSDPSYTAANLNAGQTVDGDEHKTWRNALVSGVTNLNDVVADLEKNYASATAPTDKPQGKWWMDTTTASAALPKFYKDGSSNTATAGVLSYDQTWSGNNTISGTLTSSSGALAGTWTGTYTLAGTPTIASPTISGAATISATATVTGAWTFEANQTIRRASASTTLTQATYSATTTHTATHIFQKSASGTLGTLAQTGDGDVLGTILFGGVNSSAAIAYGARVQVAQRGAAGATISADLLFNVSPTLAQSGYFSAEKNFGIGGTVLAPTGLVGGIIIGNGTAASAAATDSACMWAADISAGNSGLFVMSEAGEILSWGAGALDLSNGVADATRQINFASDAAIVWSESSDLFSVNKGIQATISGADVVAMMIPTATLAATQDSTTGAKPVLLLTQDDVSEEMIEFVTTIGVGNAIEAIGAKTLTTTHFIKVTLPGALTRYIPVGTIA